MKESGVELVELVALLLVEVVVLLTLVVLVWLLKFPKVVLLLRVVVVRLRVEELVAVEDVQLLLVSVELFVEDID